MGRTARRWIAGVGGVLVNALVLGALALLDRAPPVAEVPVMVIELERTERKPERRSASAKAGDLTSRAEAQVSTPSAAAGAPAAVASSEPAPPDVEPAWRVDPKAVERWKIAEGVPEAGWGRYHRACRGATNEHMTEDEKERCYGAWGGRRDKRPSPKFVGPIDETKWEEPLPAPRRPPSVDQEKRRHRDLCKVYGRAQKADPSAPPVLRQGACP